MEIGILLLTLNFGVSEESHSSEGNNNNYYYNNNSSSSSNSSNITTTTATATQQHPFALVYLDASGKKNTQKKIFPSHLTLSSTFLLTVGGCPLEAMHRYSPIWVRFTRCRIRVLPCTTSTKK